MEYIKSNNFTAKQMDQRLLQGYYDDAVEQGYTGTKKEFLVQLGKIVMALTNNELHKLIGSGSISSDQLSPDVVSMILKGGNAKVPLAVPNSSPVIVAVQEVGGTDHDVYQKAFNNVSTDTTVTIPLQANEIISVEGTIKVYNSQSKLLSTFLVPTKSIDVSYSEDKLNIDTSSIWDEAVASIQYTIYAKYIQ